MCVFSDYVRGGGVFRKRRCLHHDPATSRKEPVAPGYGRSFITYRSHQEIQRVILFSRRRATAPS
jgi:hypothetical protein